MHSDDDLDQSKLSSSNGLYQSQVQGVAKPQASTALGCSSLGSPPYKDVSLLMETS